MAQQGTEPTGASPAGRILLLVLLVLVALVIAGVVAYLAVVSQNPGQVTGGLEIYGT